MSYYHTGTVDPSDLESFIDFNQSPSMDKGKGRLQQPQAPSAMTSPTNSFMPLDMGDDSQLPLQPSHDYGQYKQQTGLPSQIIPQPQILLPGYNTGIDESQLFDGMGMPQNFDTNSPQDFNFDAFLDEQTLDFKQEEVQQPIRFYPGMNQQQAQMEKMMRQRQLALEAEQEKHAQASRRSISHQPLDQRTEETISRVMCEIRRGSHATSDSLSPGGLMPSIIKAKRDDDEMDEDERLLNSEEGKKLSSKERRQLRNKVSARAFRSRRKEYIGQLEGEVNAKQNECNELKRMNHALMQENARFKVLAEKLLSHSAFHPFLEELSRDPALAETLSNVANSSSDQSMPKDLDPYSASQQFAASNSETHVGLTLIPEIPVDLSSLNLGSGNNWGIPASRAMSQFVQPQVFAVTEIQQEPVDFTSLSGKSEDVLDQFTQPSKTIYPEIDAPAKLEVVIEDRSTIVEVIEPESHIDEDDETMILFAPSRSAVSTSKSAEDSLLSRISSQKATSHFELSVTTEQTSTVLSANLEHTCSRLDARLNRIEAIMAGL